MTIESTGSLGSESKGISERTPREKSRVRFDLDRPRRIGLPEAVFCEGKPAAVLDGLLARFAAPESPAILFTRFSEEDYARQPREVAERYDFDPLSRTAWNRRLPRRAGVAALVSAGNADARVLHEAARTLEYLGFEARLFEDCGVAGLWRIEEAIGEINRCGGLTAKPVFAVPTSVGYGVARGGETALSSMLASCAPGVAVMNIDNGYGAACAAARVLALIDPTRGA